MAKLLNPRSLEAAIGGTKEKIQRCLFLWLMSSDVPLLALLVALFYGAFTLLPDSHSLIVAWPWVFVWQVGLLCAVLWLLGLVWAQGKIQKLGNGFDYAAGLLMVDW
ncbi:MAG: hypothetical protein HC936_17745 [Leptolyngbyaceae cyanobacterium SU_3_3]|nr:hypothetical protein [Leptolyngbyaceae cyanobacterium SU_3_3]